ncbi:unnamed protein product, partial [Cladocopium goreaui]
SCCCRGPRRFQRFDAIVAKLKAIPEVALHVQSEVPEAEPIGSLLWRLSDLQAQLQDVSPEPTSRSPSPTANRLVHAEALPPFALRKEQREVPESEPMNLRPPLAASTSPSMKRSSLSTPAGGLKEHEGIQSSNEGAQKKAPEEVASSVAFAAAAEQKKPVEAAVGKETAPPGPEQKRPHEQQPQPGPPQPGIESQGGAKDAKAGGAENKASKEVASPVGFAATAEQEKPVEPAVAAAPEQKGQQQQQLHADHREEGVEIQAAETKDPKDAKDVKGGSENKATEEVASPAAGVAIADQKKPVEPAVGKEAAPPSPEQKRQQQQPQPGAQGAKDAKAGGAENKAPQQVPPPSAVEEIHKQKAQVEPAVPAVPEHKGQQQQQPQAERIEIQANIKDVKDVTAGGAESKATKEVASPAAFETTAEAPVGPVVAKEPAPAALEQKGQQQQRPQADRPEEGVESQAQTKDPKDAKDVAPKEAASSVAFAAASEQKKPVDPAVGKEAALPAPEQKRQHEQQPQPEPPRPGIESQGGPEGDKDAKAGGAENKAQKEVAPPSAVEEIHKQQAQVEPAVGKELAPAVGQEPTPSAPEQEGQQQQQLGADVKDGKVRGEEDKIPEHKASLAAEAPKQEVLLERADKDAAQPSPEQLESSQPLQASESGPVMSSAVLNVRQARRLRKAGQPRPVTPR